MKGKSYPNGIESGFQPDMRGGKMGKTQMQPKKSDAKLMGTMMKSKGSKGGKGKSY